MGRRYKQAHTVQHTNNNTAMSVYRSKRQWAPCKQNAHKQHPTAAASTCASSAQQQVGPRCHRRPLPQASMTSTRTSARRSQVSRHAGPELPHPESTCRPAHTPGSRTHTRPIGNAGAALSARSSAREPAHCCRQPPALALPRLPETAADAPENTSLAGSQAGTQRQRRKEHPLAPRRCCGRAWLRAAHA